MGQIKWYKRDPRAALSGMMGLTLEERGAYNAVLDLIYVQDGKLHDDDRFIAGWMGVDVRVWRRIKARLIALEKIFITDGIVRNRRADVEVHNALSRVGSARDAGKASGLSRKQKSRPEDSKNNDLDGTDVPTGVSTGVRTNITTQTKNTPLPPTDDEAARPLDRSGKPYAFAGQVIRLNERDLLSWRQRYYAIPDLIAELWGLDDWWMRQPEAKRRNWFHHTTGALNRKHQEFVTNAAAGESPGDKLIRDILARKARSEAKRLPEGAA